MSVLVSIPAGERDKIRVFAMEPPAPGSRVLTLVEAAALLECPDLDIGRLDWIALDDLAPLGLALYLVEGQGAQAKQVEPETARLDALKGHVLVVPSAAFRGQAALLRPDARLALVGTFDVARPAVQFEPLPAEGAKGVMASPANGGTDRRAMGMVALIALVAMLGFMGLMVWIAR
ncbi:MAG: hypothetical protein GC146_09295 [Limimaricola sp.]|uniref:hypothetical protein n=1 Tax=Limimaricola sp. TaxID=2211665 RepID=UPI001DDBCF61|nr:hypothetical protein [Limimaricola sp.]MBI1417405.1 hypothetical protein [Limimaricola sp.]